MCRADSHDIRKNHKTESRTDLVVRCWLLVILGISLAMTSPRVDASPRQPKWFVFTSWAFPPLSLFD